MIERIGAKEYPKYQTGKGLPGYLGCGSNGCISASVTQAHCRTRFR